MKTIALTADQRERVERDRFYHPCPQIQRRMEVLRLADHGMPQRDIAQLSGLSLASVQRRIAEFRSGGLDAVCRWNYRGKPSALREHAETLEAHFRNNPVATVAESRDVIEKKTGVRRGPTQVRPFSKNSCDLGYRKARGVPAKADPVAQKKFHDETLKPLLAQAVSRKRKVFFVAAHFVRGAFLAYLWCFVRWVVPTGSGRQRYSVLGALDAESRTPIRESTDGSVTEITFCRLLLDLREAHPVGPIDGVLDGLPTKYKDRMATLLTHNFETIELPSISSA